MPELDEFGIPKKTTTPVDEFGIPLKKKDGGSSGTMPSSPSSPSVSPSPSVGSFGFEDVKKIFNEGLRPKQDNLVMPAAVKKSVAKFEQDQAQAEVEKTTEMVVKKLGIDKQIEAKNKIKEEQKAKVQKAADDLYETPLGKFYYQVLNPLATAGGKGLSNTLTGATRLIGTATNNEDVANKIADHINEKLNPQYRWDNTIAGTQPQKLQGKLINDGKVNASKIVPSTVETLTNMAFLLGGTKGLGGSKGALVASSYINSLQGYRDEGAKAGLKGEALDNFANISSVLEGTLELVSPNDIALGNFKSKIAKAYAKEIAKGVTVRQATTAATKQFVKELGKENIQELTQGAKDKVVRLITDKVSDKPVFNDDLSYNGLKDEVLETVLLTTISTGLISAPNSIASAKPSTYEKSVWYTAAKNPEKLMTGLNKEFEKGSITEEEYNTAKNNFSKYQGALNQVEKLGYSEDQAVKMAWSVFKGEAVNKNNKAIKENPILNSSIGSEVKKQEQEIAQDIKLAGLGVPEVGSEINGTELSAIMMNAGDKGGAPSTEMIDGVKDNLYRVDEIDLKKLYDNDPEFQKYVEEYQKKSQDPDGLLIPAIVNNNNGIVDGRSRLAAQYVAGQNTAKVFKQLTDKTGPELSKIDSPKVETIKNKFDFIKDEDFVEEAFTPEEDVEFRESLPESGIANEQELADLLEKGEYAMLTGQNPDAVAVSKEANAKLNEKAQAWLSERGLKPITIFGKYGNSERSFLVPGMTKQQAVEFANEFQQDSVAHSTGLVYKDGSYNPRTEGVNLEDRFDDGGDFFSTVNVGGKKVDFSVNYDFDKKITPDNTIAQEILRDVFGQDQDIDTAIGNVSKALESTGVKVEVVPDEAAFENQIGGQRGLDGVFIAEDGKILLNEKRLKESAEAGRIIFHEGAHPVMNIIRNTNRDLYDQVVAGLKEAAKTNPEIAASLQWAQENYDIEDVQNDEAVIETIAKVGDGTLDIAALPTGFKQKLIDLINLISKALGFGQIVGDTDVAAFKKIAADVANALATGQDVADIVGVENVDQYQNDIPSTLAAGELSPEPQARVSEKGIDVYESKETDKLPVRSILELFEKFKGRAVAINSDPTRVGELTLPSGKKIFMYGGPAYLSLKDNVQAGIGFATTQLSKVKTWSGYLNKVFGTERGVTIVATQAPTSMMANSYALRYVLDAISTLPKSVLKSKEFKDEFFGKDLVLLKDAFGEKGYNDFVNKYKKADLSDAAVIDGMISEMAYKVGDDNKPASFKARGAFVSNLLGGITEKSSRKGTEDQKGYVSVAPKKFIAKQLFDRLGLNQEKLFYELGEKSLVDLYMNEGKWGMAVAGFETEPGFSIEDTQAGGVKHPLFNAKFPGTDAFLLDGAYEIDKLFAPQSIISSGGNPYTKSAAQMLAGSMYVMGEETQGEKSFQYNQADASAPRIQARRMAPNGKPSNLNEKQYEQVRTPEFKAWFGDWENDPENASKVVDENGEPRVVFHGTNVKFDHFDKSKLGSKNWMADSAYTGFFFAGDEKTSQAYVGINNADLMGLSLAQSPILTKVAEKYKAELDAANKAIEDVSQKELEKDRKKYEDFVAPIIAKLREKESLPESFISDLYNSRQIDSSVFRRINSINEQNGNNGRLKTIKDKMFDEVQSVWMKEKGLEPIILNLFLNIKNPLVIDFENNESEDGLTRNIEVAKLSGNDGVVFKNLADGADVDDIFVAFEPNQIKSATDNSGAFSTTDNRIQARKSGNLVEQAKVDKKMTQDGKGNYVFYHYSAKNFSKIDPNKFGSNTSATGRDERPGMGLSMFYTNPNTKEPGTGDKGYVVRIPMDKVYPFNADPLNFYDEAKERFEKKFPGQAFEPNKQLSFITEVANENGFPMTVAKWNIKGRNTLRAQTTEPLKVEPLTEEAQNYKAQARKSSLEQSTDFKLAAFVMRKKAEGASEFEIATGIKSAIPSMDPKEIKDLIDNPEGYINKKFSYLSEELRSNLIGRAKVQNIYKANPRAKGAFSGMEVEMDKVKSALQDNKKEQFKKAVEDWGKKWLTASKGLPDWVLAIKDKATGEKNFEVDRAARILTGLKNEAKKIGFTDWDAFSKALVAMANQPVRQMSGSTDIAMYDPTRAAAAGPALQDNELPAIVPAEVKALPAELVPYVYQMRGTIDRLTKDLVSSGYVTPEQAAVLEKNIGQYVNRAYKLFNEKGYKPTEQDMADAVKFIADQKYAALLEQYYNANAPKGTPSGSKTVGQFGGNTGGAANIDYDLLMERAIEEAKKDVNAILDRKNNPYFNAKTEARNTGILQEKQDIPEPLRKLMGEYTDPGTVFMMTVGKQAALKSASQFLTNLRDKGMGTMFFEENDPNRPVSHSVKIASDTGETKAPLNGLYTTPQIAEALESMEPTYNSLTQAWMKMVGAVRWGKTVGSVVTQFKNFESNLGFAVMNGMMFTGKNSQAFKGAAKYIKGQYTKGEVDALTEKAMKLGLVGQSVGARELADMLQSGDIHDIALDMGLNPKSKFNKVKSAAGMPFEQANKLYRLGDDFWKVYAYLNEREQLGKALFNESYDNLTPQQQEDVDTEASERVKSTWPTYDRIFEAAKYISKRAPIFGNFISFQAESLRVLANTIKLANQDMASDNPDIQALGLRRMFGVTSYLGFRAAAVYAVAKAAGIAGAGILAQFGGDDEEKNKKRGLNKAMPPFMRTGDILPIQNQKEPWRYTVYNMSSIDPYGTIPNALNAATEGREGIFGKTMEPGVMSGIVEFFSGFMEPEMTFETTWSVMNNANIKTGDPIVLPTDNDGEAAAKVSKYLFDQLKPSTIDMIERLYERDNKSAELSAMAGARPYDVDLHKSFRYGLSDMLKQLEDINKLYNRVNYSTTATEDQKLAAEQNAETSKARLIQKMHETYQDFILLGADPKVLDDMITKTRGIKSTGFDLQTKKAIKSGSFDETKLYKIKK